MTNVAGAIDELAGALREDGLDIRVDQDAAEIHVGATLRGQGARPAVIRLGHEDLGEYLSDLGRADTPEGERAEQAIGLLSTLLIESTTAVHDGESNLTTEVRLERGARGRLGLVEDRTEPGPPVVLEGDGPFGWVADRPDDDGLGAG